MSNARLIKKYVGHEIPQSFCFLFLFNIIFVVLGFTCAMLFYFVFLFFKDYMFISTLKSLICKLVLIFYISALRKHGMYYSSKVSLLEI